MLRPFTLPAVLALLLVGPATTAQAAPTGRSPPRSVVLTGKAGESPLISLSPDVPTLLLLDARITRESVQVEGRERFARVDAGDQSITLALAAPLGPTERLALRFSYREGSPATVVFLLTGQSGESDSMVNVSRPQQAMEACQVELSTTRERCEAQSQELEELRARPPTVSPATVALSDLMDQDGMRGADFEPACSRVRGELRPTRCRGLGALTWSVVVLEVSNTGAEHWAPAWAEVTPSEGGPARRARAVLSGQAAIPPGGTVSVSVEMEMPSREPKKWLQTFHTLRVCDAAGSRCLSISKVKL